MKRLLPNTKITKCDKNIGFVQSLSNPKMTTSEKDTRVWNGNNKDVKMRKKIEDSGAALQNTKLIKRENNNNTRLANSLTKHKSEKDQRLKLFLICQRKPH